MRAALDACVLYPTVLREILIAVARTGLYRPIWSSRILEEWARATRKLGPGAEIMARGEIAALRAEWPKAEVMPGQATLARLWLPDPDDIHVLAAAIDGHADLIVTQNAADFPRQTLAEEGLRRAAADEFLYDLWLADADRVAAAVESVIDTARRLSGEALETRALLKRARLPRLGKAVAG